MTHDVLLPLLRERVGAADSVVRSRTLRCAGISESGLADRLGDRARRVLDIPVAYLPSVAGIDLRLTVRGRPEGEALAWLARATGEITPILGDHFYGEEDTDLAQVVLAACRRRSHHLAVAESCTGGMLGARLTAIPGSSDVFRGGIIAYGNDVKVDFLGVSPATLSSHGAVSEPVVREMVIGVGHAMKTEASLAITGIAGPGGGTPEKPVGLVWIAARVGRDVRTGQRVYPGDRDEIRQRAAQGALDLLRRMLI
jgi:nicotinamide-nucleotide amidase